MVLVLGLGLGTIAAQTPILPGEGTRQWVGPEIWPNPLQDWHTEDGKLIALPGQMRSAHALCWPLTTDALGGSVQLRVTVDLSEAKEASAGIRVGIDGPLDGVLGDLFHPSGTEAGISSGGELILGSQRKQTTLKTRAVISLSLQITPADRPDSSVLNLTARDMEGVESSLSIAIRRDGVDGNVAVFATGPFNGRPRADAVARRGRVAFSDWTVQGERWKKQPGNAFGPVLWSQYTLSNGSLRVSAQFPPIGPEDSTNAAFEVLDDHATGQWKEVASAQIEADARVAVFDVKELDVSKSIKARVSYVWNGTPHHWPMTIRPLPTDEQPVSVAVMSCDNGAIFPQNRMVRNVSVQNPDMLFFAGDQIYEHVGGFGVAKDQPDDFAILDYLRKYYMFGLTWRSLLADRPSVIIPDDHDVYHGNVWGAGGIKLKPGDRPIAGGYEMSARFVNAVQRTQTSHLPAPIDPTPVEQNIGVYYTSMRLGGLDIAIIEDRKWKGAPQQVAGDAYVRANLEHVPLLGDRQENFLRDWVRRPAPFKVVMSQTMFAKPTTHAGMELAPSQKDLDANGWPMPARDRALSILGPGVIMLSGDQHLGMLARLGVDEFNDGPIAFMTTGTSNGHPRAWWPDQPPLDPLVNGPTFSGNYIDGMGNRITVLAVANPEPGSNKLNPAEVHPDTIAHKKGSGYAIATFDPKLRKIRFDMFRIQFDATSSGLHDQFEGFPVTIDAPVNPKEERQ
jgi:phosphodiesterase/alkaline phosphatase D-like protein